ncbi:MAG: metallopeptidase family protein [Deltaproteobacteria bacterium]|nr:metallopeptidase family protein [Deltaproteobacteria bacterium]
MEIDEVLDGIDAALDDGRREEAAKLAGKAVGRFPDSPDAWGLMGEALEGLGDLASAMQAFMKALELDPDWATGHARVAGLHLEMGELQPASERIERAFDLDGMDPEANYAFAILCEVEGELETAAGFYRAAGELEPERFFVPTRVSMDRFEAMASVAVEDLPEKVSTFIGDVPIIIEDLPERDGSGRFVNDAPLLLGECIGDHREEAGALDPVTCMPPRIVLYKLNLERACADEDELAEQIRITVLHELLHCLCLDESEVASRGLR